jgi:L-alanine-DL-glutamate epimerase-like enolase superfamily enzyme
MVITSISSRAVRIPLARPTRMSTRQLDNRDYLIVEVRASDTNEVGVGYSYAGTSGGALIANAVTELLGPLLVGQGVEDIVRHWDRMYKETLLVGRRGGVLRAMSAVDLALWDLVGKHYQIPLAVMLGGSLKPVPAYASGGYYRSDDGPGTRAVVEEIDFNISLGFRDHKIKVGGLSVAEDAHRVEAAVMAAGAEGRVALDANNAYGNVAEALAAIRAFERAAGDRGLWWVEEPLSPEDVEGHDRYRRNPSDTLGFSQPT